jgi:hypothetical protein
MTPTTSRTPADLATGDQSQHTDEPWTVAPGVYDTNPETACEFPRGPEIMSGGAHIASCNMYGEDYAERICRAVNSHNELVEALQTAVRVAEEARKIWDAAPDGMKAGKLLIALSDPTLNYRADITKMHAALKKAAGK